MEKECCQIKVTKIENGCRIEITGENIKDGNCCQMLKSFDRATPGGEFRRYTEEDGRQRLLLLIRNDWEAVTSSPLPFLCYTDKYYERI